MKNMQIGLLTRDDKMVRGCEIMREAPEGLSKTVLEILKNELP